MIRTAKDIMSRNFVRFSPDMDILEAVDLIVRHNLSGGPVVDKLGNLVGVISEIDCMRAAVQASYHASRAGQVKEVMRPASVIIDIEDSVMSIAKRFASQEHQYYYRGFPVLKNNRVVGRIILRDVLRAMSEMSEEHVGTDTDARPAASVRRTS